MRIAALTVFHRWKNGNAGSSAFTAARSDLAGSFHLDTCQRELWLTHRDVEPAFPNCGHGTGLNRLEGESAYRFLLSVCTGLESAIPGETDIFGQFKASWRDFESAAGSNPVSRGLLPDLRRWVQKLFEDTKEIRTRYLQGIGGASYGSLVRKLIRSAIEEGSAEGPILLVGAGQMAYAVAPYLTDAELWLSNRTPAKLAALREHLETLPSKGRRTQTRRDLDIRLIEDTDSEVEAWKTAAHIVICVPPNDGQDRARIELLTTRENRDGLVIHMGARTCDAAEWKTVEGFRSLDCLFSLQGRQDESRARLLDLAREACAEKARIRSNTDLPASRSSKKSGKTGEKITAFV